VVYHCASLVCCASASTRWISSHIGIVGRHPSSKHFTSVEASLARLAVGVKREMGGREKGKGKKMARAKQG